jgi:hypothetical protein
VIDESWLRQLTKPGSPKAPDHAVGNLCQLPNATLAGIGAGLTPTAWLDRGSPDFALGRWARTSRGRPKQVTDWVARLEKLEQMLAAESGSSLHVQPAWTDKNVLARLLRHQFTVVRKIPACLCQVHRLLAADRGWGGASAHLEAEGGRIRGSSRWG